MDLQTIGEIALGLLTAVLGGTGVTTHVKHKNRSNGLEKELSELKIQVAVMEKTNENLTENFIEIKEDIKYIRKKMEGGK